MKIILKIYLWWLEKQITDHWDQVLSRKIDSVQYLIDN